MKQHYPSRICNCDPDRRPRNGSKPCGTGDDGTSRIVLPMMRGGSVGCMEKMASRAQHTEGRNRLHAD